MGEISRLLLSLLLLTLYGTTTVDMVKVPKRYLRQLSYLAFVCCGGILLLLIANKHNVIYLPNEYTPSFFQQSSDSFIIDITLRSCLKVNSGKADCGVPEAGEGLMGNIGEFGGWVKIDKDLRLGSSWYNVEHFAYKKVKSEYYRLGMGKVGKGGENGKGSTKEKRDKKELVGVKEKEGKTEPRVLVDITVSNPVEDAKYKGNEKTRVPIKILKEFHAKRVFSDGDHADLSEKQRAKGGDLVSDSLTLDQDKTTSGKYAKAKQEKKGEEKKGDGEKREEAAKEVDGEKSSTGEAEAKIPLSRHDLELEYQIPKQENLKQLGWEYKSNGIWVKYGNADSEAITGIDILFGDDAVEPRPNWQLVTDGPITGLKNPSDKSAYLSIRRGQRLDYSKKEFRPTLKFNKEGKFKILQVADLHFSTGVGKCLDPEPADTKKDCQADPRTLRFLDKVLEIEKPDFVVLTGDQIFGDAAPDAETAIFKAVYPFIKRKIPYAVTLGNHDDEGSMSRSSVMSLYQDLPYSLSLLGPEDVPGYGNYALQVQGAATQNTAASLYFLDSHKYSQIPKVSKGYDWIKKAQLRYLQRLADSFKKSVESYTLTHLSMAFFHIPLTEYRKTTNQNFIGQQLEGVTAPNYNPGARTFLRRLGIDVVSVGHDHCNDYCLLDAEMGANGEENKIWLCYGGGAGEGGYGGYNGYIRRMRMFLLDTNKGEIKSWKRMESQPNFDFDHQTLVSGGKVVNLA